MTSDAIVVKRKESCGTDFGNIYLGNKMSGIPFFNAPWFDQTARLLESIPGIASVFNPAEHDRQMGFEPMRCPNGSREEADAAGFIVRDALAADWAWIAANSNGLVIGPDWRKSPGTISEIACHQALGLPVWELRAFLAAWNSPYAMSSFYTLQGLSEYLDRRMAKRRGA